MGELLKLIGWIVLSISAISSLLGIGIFKQSNLQNRYFILYILLGTLVEGLSKLYVYYFHKNNLVFFHINVLLDFIILTLFFSTIFNLKKEIIWKWALIPGIMFIVFTSLFVQNIETFNSVSLTCFGMYIISICLYYFYQNIEYDTENKQNTFTKYAVCSVFILQFASIFVLFLGNTILEIEKENQLIIWFARAVIILMVKILIMVQLINLYRYISKLDTAL